MTNVCEIPPPVALQKTLFIPKRLLMIPGPSNCPDKVLSASAQPLLGPLDKQLLKIMDEVKEGIQYAFQTYNRMTFAVSGTGHCAMETALCNSIERNDSFLVACSSIWGNRAMDMGRRIGARCHQIIFPDNEILTVEAFSKHFFEHQPDVVFICHGDSSTGLLQPIKEISHFLKRHKESCILIADCVASLGATPLFMDKWNIDILYSGSQKVLNAPPGLSPISFSSKAVKKIQDRKYPVQSFYMDALLIGNYWKCDNDPRVYHHTAPVSLMYALREALAILAEETLERSWEKHLRCSDRLYKHLGQIDLDLFISEQAYRLPTVTTVIIPNHVDGMKIVELIRDRFNIDIAGGLGTTSQKVWRIGLMGRNCIDKNVDAVCKALSICIQSARLKSSI